MSKILTIVTCDMEQKDIDSILARLAELEGKTRGLSYIEPEDPALLLKRNKGNGGDACISPGLANLEYNPNARNGRIILMEAGYDINRRKVYFDFETLQFKLLVDFEEVLEK